MTILKRDDMNNITKHGPSVQQERSTKGELIHEPYWLHGRSYNVRGPAVYAGRGAMKELIAEMEALEAWGEEELLFIMGIGDHPPITSKTNDDSNDDVSKHLSPQTSLAP